MDRANRRGQSVIYLEPLSEHPLRTALGVGIIAFFAVLMVSGYNEELGLAVGPLQWAAGLAPLVAILVVYWIVRLPRRAERALKARSVKHPQER